MSRGSPLRGWAEVSTRTLALQSLIVAVLATLSVIVLVRPWPLGVPLSWGGDTFQHEVLVQSTDWTGTPGILEATGAPHAVDWSSLPTGGERLHLVVLDALRNLTGNPWMAANLHVFLVLVLTAVIGFLVLRWMDVAPLLAGAVGLLYALTPPVYSHLSDGHLFLFGLYPIPLAVYLACRSTGWAPSRPPRVEAVGSAGPSRDSRWRAWLLSAVCVVVVALSSTYYAVFAVLTIALLGLVLAVRRLDLRALVKPLITSGSIAVVLVLSTVVDLLGDAPAAGLSRRLSDSKRYALDLVQAMFPQRDHPLGLFTSWGSSPSVALGTLATVGLVWLVWAFVRRVGRGANRSDGLVLRLAALAGVAAAIGAPGGIGWMIARAGLTELRAWSRISTTIAFCALAALGVLLTGLLYRDPPVKGAVNQRPVPRAKLLVPVAVVVLVALFDQRAALPTRGSVARDMDEDRNLVAEMERSLPAGAMVMQWPAIAFPDDFGSERLLSPALLSNDLRFSAGSFRGGPGDWQQSWALENTRDQIVAAAGAGFDALLVELNHHAWSDPEALSARIGGVLGEPEGRSTDGAWEWYDLRGTRRSLQARHGVDAVRRFGSAVVRPIGLSIDGTPGFPWSNEERDAVIGAGATIHLQDHGTGTGSGYGDALVSFGVRAAARSAVEVTADGRTRIMHPGPHGGATVVRVPMTRGEGTVRVEVVGDPLRLPEGEPQIMAELTHIQVFDASLANSDIVVPTALG